MKAVRYGAETHYVYDASGNLLAEIDNAGNIIHYYIYGAGLLAMVDANANLYCYHFNALGSTIALTNSNQAIVDTYAYTPFGVVTELSGLAFSYDNEGETTAKGTTNYGFDFVHRVKSIGTGVSFSYDGAGNRLKAVRYGAETHYIYDASGNLLAEANNTNTITRYYIYGAGLLAMVDAATGNIYCYHFNALGSTIALTDSTQTIVNKYAYTPFGVVTEQQTVSQPFKYVGQYGVMQEPNGLYYMRARYYDPSVGRFISEDPAGFGGGQVNLYAYVGGNPISNADPSGLVNWALLGQSSVGLVAHGATTIAGLAFAETGYGAVAALYGAYGVGANAINIGVALTTNSGEGAPTGPGQAITSLETDNKTIQNLGTVSDLAIPLLTGGANPEEASEITASIVSTETTSLQAYNGLTNTLNASQILDAGNTVNDSFKAVGQSTK